jgi:hypothetical protein
VLDINIPVVTLSPNMLTEIRYVLHNTIFVVSQGSCTTSSLCYSRIPVAVGVAAAYGIHDGGIRIRLPVGSRMFSSPQSSDCLWGPIGLLTNGYRGLFPRG